MDRIWTPWITPLALLLAFCAAAVHGCQPRPAEHGTSDTAAAPVPPPTLRLVLVSNIAAGMEPCGCTEDQLGGVQHLAAAIDALAPKTDQRLLLSAGALLFDRLTLDEQRATQDRWKAETLAQAMADMKLAAWAPGAADFADGAEGLARYVELSGARLLAANVDHQLLSQSAIVEVGHTLVGVVGVTTPSATSPGQLPPAKTGDDVVEAVRIELAGLRQQGAQLLVVLASMPRGPALRIADHLDEVHVLLIGDPAGQGVANDEPAAPVLIGNTLVVQPANHVQTASVVDIYLEHRAAGRAQPIVLRDAGGIERAAQIDGLARRIRKLEVRVNSWARGGSVPAADLAARKADLAKLRKRRAALEQQRLDEVEGDTFRYTAHEVRAEAGSHPAVALRMREFYRKVNEHNRRVFAERRPSPAAEGQASYVGAAACEPCHKAAYAFWKTRPHAGAYGTLQKQYKEYNLECVGCHVTGYERPGGSTVTFNDTLQGVQCEECHGPSSTHVARPQEPGLVVLAPEPGFCADACHHPPHVEGFEATSKMQLILGPGHGR